MKQKIGTPNTKALYDEVYKADGHNYGGFKDVVESQERNSPQFTLIRTYFEMFQVPDNANIVEIGCGMGRLHNCHPRWSGFEYSKTAVQLAKLTYGQNINISEADARDLPISTSSVDFIFSFAALEHIPQVERAFEEIERVLKPGGIAVLSPAWNCRPWTVKKLEQRPYNELSMENKIGKALIPLRKNLFYRMLCSFPGRLSRELRLALIKSPIKLDYSNLEPDFSLWDKYPHISDDDAFVNIDAHAALAYFVSRRWKIESHRGFVRRFTCRGEEIVVRKSVF